LCDGKNGIEIVLTIAFATTGNHIWKTIQNFI
jgi:hypothetical protein